MTRTNREMVQIFWTCFFSAQNDGVWLPATYFPFPASNQPLFSGRASLSAALHDLLLPSLEIRRLSCHIWAKRTCTARHGPPELLCLVYNYHIATRGVKDSLHSLCVHTRKH